MNEENRKTKILSSFNPLYFLENQHSLNIIAWTNHVIIFFKKERWLNSYEFFLCIYFLLCCFLIKISIIVQATFFIILKS